MSNILTIFRREMRSYFNSPVAYIVISLFLLFVGFLYVPGMFLQGGSADLRPMFGAASLALLFFAPAITMRLLAEERRSGTIEILVTLPVQDREIVIGKFLAAATLTALSIILTFVAYITIAAIGSPDFGASMCGYLGLILMSTVYVSVGVFTSSFTVNQIVAFVASLVIIFGLYLLDKVLPFLPTALASTFEFLSVDYHFRNISRGVIDSRDIIYYASMIFLFVYLAIRVTESRKWR